MPMEQYRIMELCREYGTGNRIVQLLSPQRCININVVKETRSYITISDGGVRYCFTGNPNVADPLADYILLFDHTPSKQKLIDGSIRQKRWVKHPKLIESTSEDVLASWDNQFFYKEEVDEGHPGLRKPQLGALHAVLGHFLSPCDVATVVLPTGTGKTETMLAALVAGKCKKLLVTVPSKALRTQLFNKFKQLGVLKDPKFGIVGNFALYPIVGMVTTTFKTKIELMDFVSKCNVVVTTMQIIDSAPQDQKDVYVSSFSNVFIDEAHHIMAASWRQFSERFPKERLVQFTATPFRNDGQRLDGKIIFNYSLKHAQEDGYYKTIKFLPVREYDDDKSDKAIANRAVEQLREDLSAHYNHILMARCESKRRADFVYQIYEELCPDLKPVLLYSDHLQYRENYAKILKGESRVIVCVNMLGEGFDLPELKIAAFHDIRKSLPVTLQFAGRFTRTSRDSQLGAASFVANLADVNVQEELDNLYEEDADWNALLADASDSRINNQEEYKRLLDGFRKGDRSVIPISSIYPKLSAVVYKSYINIWHPEDFFKGINGYADMDFVSYDINDKEKLLVAVMAKEQHIDGIRVKDVNTLSWNYLVIYWDEQKNLLFINSSDNAGVYKDIAKNVIGEAGKEPSLIKGIDVFRIFNNIKRTKLRNVGLKVYLGQDIRFRMHAGRDVENALSGTELKNSEKSFVVGDGFENGDRTSIGASFKGRIWSLTGAGDILTYKKWCIEQGNKLIDESIDGNQILSETLIPKTISKLPEDVTPFAIDWDEHMLLELETHYVFDLLGNESYLYDTVIDLLRPNPIVNGVVLFVVSNESQCVEFKLELYENTSNPENVFPDFKVTQVTDGVALIKYGKAEMNLADYFSSNAPNIFFTDGATLCGTEYLKLKVPPVRYNREKIIVWDWKDVNLSEESQGVGENLNISSIQYRVVQELMKSDYDIIYDDDNSGEIADVITLKNKGEMILIGLYHLKFAHGGQPSNRIDNLYEVCGQAQKSSNWKYKEAEEFVSHLLRREVKRKGDQESSRILKGDHNTLVKLLKLVKKKVPVSYSISIVQPGISKTNVTDEILTLLGVTDSFLKDRTGIDLNVIASK